MNRIIRFAIAGLLGTLVGWLILEPTPLMPNDARSVGALGTIIVGMVIGGFLGFGIGLCSSQSGFSSRDGVKVILAGIFIGAGGGIVGLTLGNIIWTPFSRMQTHDMSALVFLGLLFGRAAGWALLGLIVGLSQGIAVMSTKKMTSGLIGGFVGGGIGGLVFQMMAFARMFPPPMVRFVSFAILGLSVGLFIAIAEEVAKKAWLIKDLGRGEGKQFEIFRNVTVLGRDELADVPVFGDNMVAKRHAQILMQSDVYTLEDLGSSTGTTLNGTLITKQQLKDGDIIHLGTNKFIFRTKLKGAKAAYTPGQPATEYVPPTATDSLVCPFCGERKDAAGNCSCSLQPSASPQPGSVSDSTHLIDSPPSAAQSSGGARLIGISGPYASIIFELSTEQSIGREEGREIPLPSDPTISRTHARIFFENSQWYIEDSGSANGTYVDDVKITRRELTSSSIIRIGKSSFRFDI